MPGPTWEKAALCATADPDVFSPDDYRGETVQEAKAICDRCPVRAQCLAAAMAEEGKAPAAMRGSIRGGHTPAERAAIYRRQRRQQAA
ncbi:WhiB family transcriptional regulator [Streptomyces sp. WAC05858]|uniref:WhiB family transcriptional regulator n=1 Tax=Streptomyces TaxID=1883 RepID=UPI000F7AA6CB|nr:WhiB family transcriptional regulator [Streptomyces sp. WAC05858]RSS37932.1 WhiB family transcriptional regulator [Streptomyces sp. WAC05858]